MDRLQRLIDQGRGADAFEIAQKWLVKNEGDRRTEAVLALVDEGTWQVLSEEPNLQGLVDYRADFPESPHHDAARELEASLAYYAAIKAGKEAAFLEVVDNYAGTKAVPDALEKAQLCAQVVWQRLALDGFEYAPEERLVEFVGANVCHEGIAIDGAGEPSEVVLRMGVKGPDRSRVDRFGPELVPLVTSGPPGVTGFAGGRPKATEIIGFWPALLHKSKVETRVTVFES